MVAWRQYPIRQADAGSPELTGCAINWIHYNDVIVSAIASQITSLTIVYSTVYSGADQRKHQSSASLVFVRKFDRWPVNSPHKWPVIRKMFPFDDVFMLDNKLVIYVKSVPANSYSVHWICHTRIHNIKKSTLNTRWRYIMERHFTL